MITSKSEHSVNYTLARGVNRVFKMGGAGISGASAGALVGSALAGLHGALIGAVIIAGANALLDYYNEPKF